MDEYTYRLVIGLILIDNVESCKNSDGLIRVLNRRFGIIEIVAFVDALEKEKLIKIVDRNCISHYSLTDLGREYLNGKQLSLIYKEAVKRNPEEHEYISDLLKLMDYNFKPV